MATGTGFSPLCDKTRCLHCLHCSPLAEWANQSGKNKRNAMIRFGGLGTWYRWVSLMGYWPKNFIHMSLTHAAPNLKSLPRPGSCENDPRLSCSMRKEWEPPKINYQAYNWRVPSFSGRKKDKQSPWLQISDSFRKTYSPAPRPCFGRSTICQGPISNEERVQYSSDGSSQQTHQSWGAALTMVCLALLLSCCQLFVQKDSIFPTLEIGEGRKSIDRVPSSSRCPGNPSWRTWQLPQSSVIQKNAINTSQEQL